MDELELAEIIRREGTPLTAKRVAEAALGSSGAKAVRAVEGLLSSLRESGRIHQFPPEQRGWAVRFGSVSPVEWVRGRILNAVKDGSGKVSEKQLKDRLHKWELKVYDEAVGGLVRNGRLHYLAVRYKYVLSSAPTPFDYLLGRQVTALKEILERINRRRTKALTLGELRSFLDGAFAAPGELSEGMIRAWYDADLPLCGGVTTVPIPWTWKHYVTWCEEHSLQPDLGLFHACFRKLFLTQRIELVPHSGTHDISGDEAQLALSGSSGEVYYYWRWR